MTTFGEVKEWMEQAKMQQCSHVLIVRMMGTQQHFPVFVRQTDDLNEKIKMYNGVNHQIVDEVIPV